LPASGEEDGASKMKRFLEANSGGLTMKGCIGAAREPREIRIHAVCDRLVNLIPSLLPLFVVMFGFVLFCIWHFPHLSWWLVALVVALIACMVGVAAIFAIGSRVIGLKIKSSCKLKNKVKSLGEVRVAVFEFLESRK
jgi:hypothetical protein